jgi:class 3 adenylate cyclase/pimeloyl-ACP methyl ester carboxylesterase
MSEGQRRLAAIVFSDIVAYTARMAANESTGLELRERHRQVWETAAASHRGQIVDENGDELVLLFESALDAVRAGLEVGEAVRQEGDLELRVGAHSGDVLLRDGQIYGDPVNVAARVRAEAQPGGLVVTREVAQSVRNQPGLRLRELGARRLKNVPHPVAVFSIESDPDGAGEASPSPRRGWLRSAGLAVAGVLVLGIVLGLSFPDARNRMAASLLVRNISLLPAPEHHELSFTHSRDGTRIAWGSFGQGPPVVVVQTWFTHVEAFPRVYQDVIELGKAHRVIHYDGRGFGLSQREVQHSPEARLEDLDAVIAAAGLERFSIFGLSSGSPTAIAYAGLHPKRVDRLVLYGATADPDDEDATMQAVITLMRNHFGTDRFESFFRDFLIPGASPFEIRLYEEVLKLTGNAADIGAFYDSWFIEDVSELAIRVRAPTLVVHVRGDHLIPLDWGLRVASLIPNAEVLILEGRNHVLLPGDEDGKRFRLAMMEFLGSAD